jgi:nitroimidazol reductase NimA-like FMN-containing flavoprotein (pyridoxamine 5'-phosphate oxidase superfamily)
MLEKMRALVRKKDMCVLATSANNKPHCSLMAYVANEQCNEIYMVTDKLTKKYSNLKKNPSVCLLIDTRDEDSAPKRLDVKALTVAGRFQEVHEEKKKGLVQKELLRKHPHLGELVSLPNATVFSVKVESFLLLEGVAKSYFETLI